MWRNAGYDSKETWRGSAKLTALGNQKRTSGTPVRYRTITISPLRCKLKRAGPTSSTRTEPNERSPGGAGVKGRLHRVQKDPRSGRSRPWTWLQRTVMLEITWWLRQYGHCIRDTLCYDEFLLARWFSWQRSPSRSLMHFPRRRSFIPASTFCSLGTARF